MKRAPGYATGSELQAKLRTDNMAVTKADLRDTLFEEIGLNKRESGEFVDLFFGKICSLLEEGHAVKLSGFGSFNLRDKPERLGRNPKTGVEVPILPRRVVTFKSGQKLKKEIGKNFFHLYRQRMKNQAR